MIYLMAEVNGGGIQRISRRSEFKAERFLGIERRTTITLPLALTQVFCYRVVAVASVECYPKLEAMNGNCQQVGAEENLGSGARSVWASIQVGKGKDPQRVRRGGWLPP